jgi:hypothetical protein
MISYFMSHPIAKVIEIIGSSEQGWKGAAQVAIDEAKKTLHGTHVVCKSIFCRRLVLTVKCINHCSLKSFWINWK